MLIITFISFILAIPLFSAGISACLYTRIVAIFLLFGGAFSYNCFRSFPNIAPFIKVQLQEKKAVVSITPILGLHTGDGGVGDAIDAGVGLYSDPLQKTYKTDNPFFEKRGNFLYSFTFFGFLEIPMDTTSPNYSAVLFIVFIFSALAVVYHGLSNVSNQTWERLRLNFAYNSCIWGYRAYVVCSTVVVYYVFISGAFIIAVITLEAFGYVIRAVE